MDTTTIDKIVSIACKAYKTRGFVTIGEVQDLLDNNRASIIDTSIVMRRLEETGCKLTDSPSSGENIEQLAADKPNDGKAIIDYLHTFYAKEQIDQIKDYRFILTEYENGMLYYAYLRLMMKLTKASAKRHISLLQEAYDIYLPDGEDKAIFDIESASFIDEIYFALHDRKKFKKATPMHKTVIANYKHYLTQNRHRIIANCEAAIEK